MALEFEWDPEKAEANRKKHRVSFDEASTVFADPLSLTIPDPDHSEREERMLLLGTSGSGGCWSSPTRGKTGEFD